MIEFLLLFIAITLLFILVPIASLYIIVKSLLHRRTKELTVWFYGTARTIDIFGNIVAAELFNDIFIKPNGYKFGNRKETISSVIGKNQRTNTLKLLGKTLRFILDFIEPGHCEESAKLHSKNNNH